MQNEVVKINEKAVAVKEFNGQRVITFRDIDLVHERVAGTARKRFNDNKKYFIKDEDYFVRNSDEAKDEFNIVAPNGLYLITEQGYLMLVKSFTDDLAWRVQRQLVKNYFNPKPTTPNIIYQYPLPAATFESVANLGRLVERVMRTEGACPHEIAIVLKSIFQQAGIEMQDSFVKIPSYEQLALDMVEK